MYVCPEMSNERNGSEPVERGIRSERRANSDHHVRAHVAERNLAVDASDMKVRPDDRVAGDGTR